MTKQQLEFRILGILKEFERLKNELPNDLKDEIPTIAELICDMMKYPHTEFEKFQQLYQFLEDYYKDEP